MIYSQPVIYALQALGYLASLPPTSSVKVKEMASTLDIPEHFLGKVLSHLVKRKFVSSAKGPTGGFSLEVDPSRVTLYRIMAALDALTTLEDKCVMGFKECTPSTPCAFHDNWTRFKDDTVEKAQRLTLVDLSRIVLAKLRPPEAATPENEI